MTQITSVALHRVLDSHGNPAVKADVLTESGGFDRVAAPSGASTGEYEAIELPPTEAITAARRHAVPRLVGEVHASNQREVDATLRATDGSENFSEIGMNNAIAIPMTAAKAGADVLGVPPYQHLDGTFHGDNFPTPFGDVIGGGGHAKEATSIQGFLAASADAPSVSETVFANAKVHAHASEILNERGVPAAKGDEGAWAPPISDARVFEIMSEVIFDIENGLGLEIGFGLDIATSEMFEDDVYHYGDETKAADEQVDCIAEMVDEYDLIYVEDPLDGSGYEGSTEFTEHVGDRTLIRGDDLFVTSTSRLQDGIDVGAANSILVKPNQIGTLTNAFDAVELTSRNEMNAVISRRSGKTEDTVVTHLTVATDVPFIETDTVQGERTAKLNELIRTAGDAV